MMVVEKIKYDESLRSGTDKLNASIEQSNSAISEAGVAKNTANQAVSTSQEAVTKAESIQAQFNQVVIEGDSSVEAAQARVDTKNVAQPTLKARLDKDYNEVTAQLAQKAKESDLAIERSRINSLTTLPNGSTTGDAELIDGRIGQLGFNYGNLGTSIREQVKSVIGANSGSKQLVLPEVFNGATIRVEKEFFKGQEIEISLQADEGIIRPGVLLAVGLIDVNGVQVNGVTSVSINEPKKHIVSINTKGVVVWIDPTQKISSGTVTLSVKHAENVFESINTLKTNSDVLVSEVIGDNVAKPFRITPSYNVSTTVDLNVYAYHSFKKGEKITIELTSGDLIETSGRVLVGVGYPNGEKTNALTIPPNKEVIYTLEDNASFLHFWLDRGSVLKNGSIQFIIKNYIGDGLKGQIANIESRVTQLELSPNHSDLEGKTFSILGDSYSTYYGWLPSGYSSWYKETGNSEPNDVSSVKDTWWWKLSNETKLSLLINSSFSGSTISNTGYSGADSTATSFVTRMKKDIGEQRNLSPKPNVIIIFGGTNDDWAGSPVGALKYSGWTDEDLKSVLPAFCYMLDYLKLWNPHARIINVVNTGISSPISTGMQTACTHYNVENLVLTNIGKEGGHPNKAGMNSIKDQIINIL